MIKHKIWFKLVPQVMKSVVEQLVNCRATFECNMSKDSIFIYDVTAFNLDETATSEPMYAVTLYTENNTKVIYIHHGNVKEFTVHF